jgi:tetratricopeptide (TPR) repeat protein
MADETKGDKGKKTQAWPPPVAAADIPPPRPSTRSSIEIELEGDEIDVDVDEPASIDKILSRTKEGWSIEEQMKSLKEAAQGGAPRTEPEGIAHLDSAALTTDVPNNTPLGASPSPPKVANAESKGPPALPPRVSNRPPPLPPQAQRPSKAPPPPATGPASKAPPPIPRSPEPPRVEGARVEGARVEGARVEPANKPDAARPAPDQGRSPEPPRAEAARPSPRNEAPKAPAAKPKPPPVQKPVPAEIIQLSELLAARVQLLESEGDRVGLGRALIEQCVLAETYGDETKATAYAERALAADPELGVARSILRRRMFGRTQLAGMLEHIEHEIDHATTEAQAVELLVERARLSSASHDRGAAIKAWETALSRAPIHAAAIKGLESELLERTLDDTEGSLEDYVHHLGRVADAYAAEPELAGWVHAERALHLTWRLGKTELARGALERALRLAPGSKPVRRAYMQLLAGCNDTTQLSRTLEEEANYEADGIRAARLELDAATMLAESLKDEVRAVELLERASGRAPTSPLVDKRILDDLVRLHEKHGHYSDAAHARRRRLRFVTEARALTHEYRALAQLHEKMGDLGQATLDLEQARLTAPDDWTLVEELDRLLAAQDLDHDRVALWTEEAHRTQDASRRGKALLRAANLTEQRLGQPGEAVKHLRAAWVAAPGDPELSDALARLLGPRPADDQVRDLRSLVELHAQAAQATPDTGRKVAYLEKAAVLWEELLGEPRRALRIYEEILALEGGRRSAVLGLARNATRVGDERALARALLEEAKLADDGALVLNLRVRAAQALSKLDPARALALVSEVLEADSAHAAARALETRLHEEAGRFELVATSLKARVDTSLTTQDKVSLLLSLAQVQSLRLGSPLLALESLKMAQSLDGRHPVPLEEIARVMESSGDAYALRDAHVTLGEGDGTPLERALHFFRAGEICEHRLSDDESARKHYLRALDQLPEEEIIAERIDRVLVRRALADVVRTPGSSRISAPSLEDRRAFLTRRLDRGPGPEQSKTLRLDLALTTMLAGKDHESVARVLEGALEVDEGFVPALRTLEYVHGRARDHAALGKQLSSSSNRFTDVRARLGALWSLAWLEEWRGDPKPEDVSTYLRILDLDPTDPGALEGVLRKLISPARRGDVEARGSVIAAQRSLSALSTDEGPQLAANIRTALLLEAHERDVAELGPELLREALERYRTALLIEPLSVTAATGLARLSGKLSDISGSVAASVALADLAVDPLAKAKYLTEGAELLLGAGEDERLGSREARSQRAATLLESALEANPDAVPAAARLSHVRVTLNQAEALVHTFRRALRTAKTKDAIVFIGNELAKVARDELGDLVVAIDAMRYVREQAKEHIPSLLTLSELCIAQRAWPEAIETLEEVAAKSKEPAPKLTALFALASIHQKILLRPDEAERALRRARDVDEDNPRAIRALIHHLATKAQGDEVEAALKLQCKLEIAQLLERLATVEKDKSTKCEILLELADIRGQLKDQNLVEKALIEAVAQAPQHARAFARLGRLFKVDSNFDAVSYARALAAVIGRGLQLGHEDSRWYATLGHIEVESLGRLRDGVAHLKKALMMQPQLHESRFELAQAYSRLGAHDEAAKTIFEMIDPVAEPLSKVSDPAAALELLERALGSDRRPEEAIVVSELRAICGELDPGRQAWLRARKLPPLESHHSALDRQALISHTMPAEGRHVLLDVAAAVAGLELRLLRADLSDLGLSSKDKVGRRSGHPTRALLDRVSKALGLSDLELVVTERVSRTRVLAQDSLWIAVPKSLTELPEPTQLAALARAASRIAFGFPWLEELPPPHIEAFLVACARQVHATYTSHDGDVLTQKLVSQYEPGIARELHRKQKQALEKCIGTLASGQGKAPAIDVLIGALAKAELRAAYLVTGDVLATIDELRALDPQLMAATDVPGRDALLAVLEHPYAGDVARFALSGEATALRRRVASTWAGSS